MVSRTKDINYIECSTLKKFDHAVRINLNFSFEIYNLNIFIFKKYFLIIPTRWWKTGSVSKTVYFGMLGVGYKLLIIK